MLTVPTNSSVLVCCQDPRHLPCAGLEYLRGLTNLEAIDLENTKVTDAGLVHLKGLTNLQSLNLRHTQVTDAGVKKLQQALPKCKIRH